MRAPLARRIAFACFAPRIWIAAGVAFVTLALALDYLAKSAAADRLLAIRQGPPVPVAIEDFDAARHVHEGGEVGVVGELVPGPVESFMGAAGELILLPLGTAGEAGRALAELRGVRGAVRPPARPDGRTTGVAGYLAIPLAESTAVAPFRPIGAGRDGIIVAVSGRLASPDLQAALPREVAGPIIVPFRRSREVALATAPAPGALHLPLSLAVLCFLVATAAKLRARAVEQEDDSWVAPAPARSIRFQPIASQSEMTDDAEDDAAPALGILDRIRRLMPPLRQRPEA